MKLEQWLGENNQLGMDIWHNKYQQNNETFDEWLDRISNGNEELRKLIEEKKFIFAGRILSNRGLYKEGKKVTYSNCYVLTPPEDNIESIFECASKLARTFSYGGGCGIDISKLSPNGAKINNTAKQTTGAVSFMQLYNMVTDLIGQNGRRGALMLSISCDHPDLEDFITIKQDLDKVTKANISIRITDQFMEDVVNCRHHFLTYVRQETGEVLTKKVYAPDIFRKICEGNWDYAEPGFLYWDTIKKHNLLCNDPNFEYAGVNPCAEEPLPAGGSCLLGSLNLSAFVTPNNGLFDLDSYRKAVEIAVVALNEVLDEGLPLHPLAEQRESVENWRQIGLGICGLADAFIKMGKKYGDEDSLQIADLVAFETIDTALRTSAKLAAVHGTYPMYNEEAVLSSDFLKFNTSPETLELIQDHGLRNSQLLTIAPTGSISTMLGISGGIEPIYDTHYDMKTESLHGHEEYYRVYTPIVKQYMEEHNIKDVKDLPDFFVTAKKLDYMNRLKMQATWQHSIDASISSTVNIAKESTVEDVMEIYMNAWSLGLKGVTIFRDGCKRGAVLISADDNKEDETEEIIATPIEGKFDYIEPISREQLGGRLSGSTYKKEVACGHLYITINRDENDNLVEVFIDPGKSGGCTANAECLGRYASACMRAGMKIESIIDITKGVKCSACSQAKGSKVKHIDGMSCGDVVAKTIKEEYERFHKNQPKKTVSEDAKDITHIMHNVVNIKTNACPECGIQMIAEGGCVTCKNCGYSKCD